MKDLAGRFSSDSLSLVHSSQYTNEFLGIRKALKFLSFNPENLTSRSDVRTKKIGDPSASLGERLECIDIIKFFAKEDPGFSKKDR